MANEFSGSIDSLPNEIKRGDWFDIDSNYLFLGFQSDESVTQSGFKLELTSLTGVTDIIIILAIFLRALP